MFKHILIPTDGSPMATKAVKAGIKLAKEVGARVTAYYALDPMPATYFGEGYAIDAQVIADIERSARSTGEKSLAKVALAAKAARVRFTAVITKPVTTYEGIIAVAKKNKCDVIFMASHGHQGIASLVLGSVTQKVLSHSKIPVLVYR